MASIDARGFTRPGRSATPAAKGPAKARHGSTWGDIVRHDIDGARRLAPRRLAVLAAVALGGCLPVAGTDAGGDPSDAPITGRPLLETDVEAPERFRAREEGLWDGRPSLGGIWVAAPDVIDPERVVMRNPGNGQEVVGALFRRERITPGPRLQLSSEAAVALGILAGSPTEIEVVALLEVEPEPIPDVVAETDPTDASRAEAAPAAVRANPFRRLFGRFAPAPSAAVAATVAPPPPGEARPTRRP